MRFDSITAPVKVEISVQIYTTATTDHAILIDFYTCCYKRYVGARITNLWHVSGDLNWL